MAKEERLGMSRLHVWRVGGSKDGATGERDRERVGVELLVDDVCMFQDEMAQGASVRKGVLCGGG